MSSDGALDLFLRAKRLYQPKMLFETVFAGDAELNAALVAVAREVAPDLYTEHQSSSRPSTQVWSRNRSRRPRRSPGSVRF